VEITPSATRTCAGSRLTWTATSGSSTCLVFFVLSPTVYGVENTLMYLPNDLIGAAFDGLPILISPLVGLTVFVVLAFSTQDTYAPAALDRDGRPALGVAGTEG